MRRNKKGALELSINAIVIVILAMTLLGLGLGFVRGMFRQITDTTDDTFAKLNEDLMQRIGSSDAEVMFSQTSMKIDRRGSKTEGLAVKNEDDVEIKYGIKIRAAMCPQKKADPNVNCPDIEEWFTYFKGDKEYTLKAAESAVNKIQLNVPNITPGLYLIKITAYEEVWTDSTDNCDPEATPACQTIGQTELFLTVN